MFHADGTTAMPPIALCEVQGYAYAAWRAAAELASVRGDLALAKEWSARADRLRTKFEEAFWLDDLGTYALALDGDKRPCRVHTSNAAHCLFTGIASTEHARQVVASLMAEASYAGWGSGQSPPAKHGTTRCCTTMDRSGLTTTPLPQPGWRGTVRPPPRPASSMPCSM